jgi:hypothetical protein
MRRRLSELLEVEAFDAGGDCLGRVRDVRLVQDGPLIEGFGHGLRVAGVLVGPRWRGTRLGFTRAAIKGPWPLTALFRRLEAANRYYHWDDVEAWDADRIRLRAGAAPTEPPG